jgi:hypothetical protein
MLAWSPVLLKCCTTSSSIASPVSPAETPAASSPSSSVFSTSCSSSELLLLLLLLVLLLLVAAAAIVLRRLCGRRVPTGTLPALRRTPAAAGVLVAAAGPRHRSPSTPATPGAGSPLVLLLPLLHSCRMQASGGRRYSRMVEGAT